MELFNLKEDNYVNPSINNIRELGLLEKTLNSLKIALNDNKNNSPLDIISVNLTNAFNYVLEILGETSDTDVAKEIFSRFCVGK